MNPTFKLFQSGFLGTRILIVKIALFGNCPISGVRAKLKNDAILFVTLSHFFMLNFKGLRFEIRIPTNKFDH